MKAARKTNFEILIKIQNLSICPAVCLKILESQFFFLKSFFSRCGGVNGCNGYWIVDAAGIRKI